ncbi:MAG: hypothetical protein AAFN93_13850 [Bacteroidota bacterium]
MEKIEEKEVNQTNGKVDPRIDVIKELIFGENIQAYEEQFKKLRSLLETSNKKIEDRVSEIEERLIKDLEKLEGTGYGVLEELEKAHTQRLDNIEANMIKRSELGDMFLKIGQKLKGDQ